MIIQARIQTRRWREGNAIEQETHMLEVHREYLLADNDVSMVTIFIYGLLGMFISMILPLVVAEILGDPALLEALSIFLMPPIMLAFWMLYRARKRFIQTLAKSDDWVRLMIFKDKLLGTPIAQMECQVEEALTTPIDIEIDEHGDPPALRWWPTGPPSIEELRIVDNLSKTSTRQGSRRSMVSQGEVSLAEEDRPSFDLTRSAKHEDRVYLACRAQNPGEEPSQLSLILGRPGWMDDASFERLPVMEREGAVVMRDDAEALLRFVSDYSQGLGRPVEALAEQAEVVTVG